MLEASGALISALVAIGAAAYTVGKVSQLVDTLREELHSLRKQVSTLVVDLEVLKAQKNARRRVRGASNAA